MKLFISSNTAWYLYNFRLKLAQVLADQGDDVMFLSPEDGYEKKLNEAGFRHVPVKIDNKGKNPIRDLRTYFKYISIFKEHKPDIILQYTIKPNIYGTLAAHRLGIKCINNIAGLGNLFISKTLFTSIAKTLYKVSQKHAFHIFFQNEDDMHRFIREGIIKKGSPNYERIPGSGVDLSRFQPVPKKDTEHIDFILIARLLWDKGVGEYVEAARVLKKKYPQTRFKVLGFTDTKNPNAISKETVDSWVEEGAIEYLGASDHVEEILRDVDCVVLPSYYREGVPRSLLEAGAMGKPIITTDSVGCRETVIDGETGFLCKPKDVNDLAQKMGSIITMTPEERSVMGIRGHEYIARTFDESKIIERYLGVLNQLT